MKRTLVGGPLLGLRDDGRHPAEDVSAFPSKAPFQPLITPMVGAPTRFSSSKSSTMKPEQFVLLPHRGYIQVLAYKTGKIVANFVPTVKRTGTKAEDAAAGDDKNRSSQESETRIVPKIESVCLATYPRKPRDVIHVFDSLPDDKDSDSKEQSTKNKSASKSFLEEEFEDHVVLAGCSDGSIYEFSLLALLPMLTNLHQKYGTRSTRINVTRDDVELASYPCFCARRVFQILADNDTHSLCHLTAPPNVSHSEYGMLVYSLTRGNNTNDEKAMGNESNFSVSLYRLFLPPFFDDSVTGTQDVIRLTKTEQQKVAAIKCKERRDECDRIKFSTAPFQLESVVRDRAQDTSLPTREYFFQRTVFLVVARSTAIHVYCERLSDIGFSMNGQHSNNMEADGKSKLITPVVFSMPDCYKNPLCSMSISVNKNDIACGFFQGDIVIKSSLFALVEEYCLEKSKSIKHQGHKNSDELERKRPDHPAKNIIESRVHWHSHPVATLCYDPNSPASDPILYSGGDESVLVTWQLTRGSSRPSDHLPRLAQGGIVHAVIPLCAEGSNNSILVYCEDNTLQLIESHNKGLVWRFQGLPFSPERRGSLLQSKSDPIIVCDPKNVKATFSSRLLLCGLSDAPGMLQWYETRQQRVVDSLEVAPYNRVSGLENKDKVPMPAPSVIHMALSNSGVDLITVDKIPTENQFVGGVEKANNDEGSDFGVITTVKFWVCNSSAPSRKGSIRASTQPYSLVATMANPHGMGNGVTALAISKDGHFACTVSNHEKSFRLWQKVATTSNLKGEEAGTDASSRRLPTWICQYKVTSPSGYSNHPTGKDAVAFSSDSSVLAIGYGHMITIWDRQRMALLTCLPHLNGDDAVESVDFIEHDLVLSKSSSGVSAQSPFPLQEQNDMGWGWMAPGMGASMCVSSTCFLEAKNAVAVSLYALSLIHI